MDLQKELERCAKCGQCRSVCPVFLALKDETLVARGRLAIIQARSQSLNPPLSPFDKGGLRGISDASDLYPKILHTCLMCRRCEDNCPSLVETGAVFKSERQRIAHEKGLPLLLRFGFRWVLPNRWLYNSVMSLASLVSRLFGRSSAPTRHLPLYFANLFQRMPKLASRSALSLIPSSPPLQKGGEGGFKVAIFVGCAANYIYPEIIEALVSILDQLKIPYVIPQAQVCCGMPALLSGDGQTAQRLMKMNQEAFNTDTIITVCPTCNRMLTEEYALNGVKVIDAVEYLMGLDSRLRGNDNEQGVLSSLRSSVPTAYHQPCHSAGTKMPEIIKTFLKANTDYNEIEDVCCGGGGLFTFKYPELSDLIGKVRVDSLRDSLITQSPNPPITQLVTNCPGCMMQLEYLLSANNIASIKVRHALNLYSDCLPR